MPKYRHYNFKKKTTQEEQIHMYSRQFLNTGIYTHLQNLHGRESNRYPCEFEFDSTPLRYLQVHLCFDLSIIIMNSAFGHLAYKSNVIFAKCQKFPSKEKETIHIHSFY